MENLLLGFTTAVSASNLLWCLIGVTLGTLVGVLPGLGTMAAISMLLPITYHINDPITSIIFLSGLYYGTQYGGSTTSILLKMPGEASSMITAIDGYAMAQRGRAGAALTISAVGSFVAGCVATVLIALLAIPMSELAFKFGPAEYASMMLLGLLACVSLSQGNTFKGIIMVVFGIFLGMIGTNVSTGQTRFTMDIIYLVDGITFAVLVIGLFGVAELLYNLRFPDHARPRSPRLRELYPTRQEIKDSVWPIARGTTVGSILGTLPGGGTIMSSFASYTLEKRLSRRPEDFGKGAVAGGAGPESANNAAAQTGFIPTLALGLPITPVMSLMLAVLVINGITPGPQVISQQPGLFWGLIISMWIGNLLLVVLNLPLIGIWTSVLKIPRWILYPLIAAICVYGAYSINNSWFDILLLAIFAVMGYLLKIFNFEVAPLAMGFIIGPMLEEYGERALTISRGDWTIFLEKPISLTFLIIAAGLLVLGTLWKRKHNLAGS